MKFFGVIMHEYISCKLHIDLIQNKMSKKHKKYYIELHFYLIKKACKKYIHRTASYEITLVRLSFRPPLSFLKIGSLVFSETVHDDS